MTDFAAEPGRFALPRVKVCGVRSMADIGAALAVGLDAIGLVEHPPSPRAVTAEAAAAVVAALPTQVLCVAVFVDRTPEEVALWLEASGAHIAQLCGSERPDEWTGFGRPLLRRLAVDEHADEELERWREVAHGFVLDHPGAPGGSGHVVDLERARRLAARAPCLLAGGLDEANVAERIARAAPHGVDASSRLESAPGVKDPARVERFVRAATRALAEAAR